MKSREPQPRRDATQWRLEFATERRFAISFLSPTVVGLMLAYGAGASCCRPLRLAYLIASFALLTVGVETKGRALEEITQEKFA